jgi:hypothetical protein
MKNGITIVEVEKEYTLVRRKTDGIKPFLPTPQLKTCKVSYPTPYTITPYTLTLYTLHLTQYAAAQDMLGASHILHPTPCTFLTTPAPTRYPIHPTPSAKHSTYILNSES